MRDHLVTGNIVAFVSLQNVCENSETVEAEDLKAGKERDKNISIIVNIVELKSDIM